MLTSQTREQAHKGGEPEVGRERDGRRGRWSWSNTRIAADGNDAESSLGRRTRHPRRHHLSLARALRMRDIFLLSLFPFSPPPALHCQIAPATSPQQSLCLMRARPAKQSGWLGPGRGWQRWRWETGARYGCKLAKRRSNHGSVDVGGGGRGFQARALQLSRRHGARHPFPCFGPAASPQCAAVATAHPCESGKPKAERRRRRFLGKCVFLADDDALEEVPLQAAWNKDNARRLLLQVAAPPFPLAASLLAPRFDSAVSVGLSCGRP